MHAELVERAISYHFLTSPGSPNFQPLNLSGLQGWQAIHPYPSLSLVRWLTDDYNLAEDALSKVVEQFRRRGGGFEWITGPQCEAAGLTNLLKQYDFKYQQKIVVMALTLCNFKVTTEQDKQFHIWEVHNHVDPVPAQLLARGFSVQDDVAEAFHQLYTRPAQTHHTRVFLAAQTTSSEPVAVGYLSLFEQENTALLRVSCSLPEFRRTGLYRALVLRRIHEAMDDGRETLFVHAYSKASETCLLDLGFKQVAPLSLHRWEEA